MNTSPKSLLQHSLRTSRPRNTAVKKIQEMIVDDIQQTQLRGDRKHVVTLLHVLHHFLKTHPEAKPSHHPWSKRF
jgi:hypothetical protein